MPYQMHFYSLKIKDLRRRTDNIIVRQRMMGHLFIGLRSNKKVIVFSFNEATDWWSMLVNMGGGGERSKGEKGREDKTEGGSRREGEN